MLLREKFTKAGLPAAFQECRKDVKGVSSSDKGALFFLHRLIEFYEEGGADDQKEFEVKFPVHGLSQVGVTNTIDIAQGGLFSPPFPAHPPFADRS